MGKHKMVQVNLVKNSIAAYFAALEIHNKPNIAYRYETVTLLIMNAWELALKAYIKKYIKTRSIYTSDGHTISIDKSIEYVNEHRNSLLPNSFTSVKMNILEIENYRNNIAHFYCSQLEPYIFMLVARSALNFVDFMKAHFLKDIMMDDGLFIMPLGFKLPFRPEEFLSNKVAAYNSSEEARAFIQDVINVTKSLREDGIEDSIVLGFDIYLESINKSTNSDILAAITTIDNADTTVAKVTKIRISNDPNAQPYQLSDSEFRNTYKYTHDEVVLWCKSNIVGFKQDRNYNTAKRMVGMDKQCVYTRRLDINSSKSQSKQFYSDLALNRIKEEYVKLADNHINQT